jgi:hypothetical protein
MGYTPTSVLQERIKKVAEPVDGAIYACGKSVIDTVSAAVFYPGLGPL